MVKADGNLCVKVRSASVADTEPRPQAAGNDREKNVVDRRVGGPGGADRLHLGQRRDR